MAELHIKFRKSKKEKIEDNIKEILEINPFHDANLLEKGLIFMYDAHKDQVRLNKKPYAVHPNAVAELLARYKYGTIYVVSAHLHDIPEETDITVEDIRAEFGDEIADIVDDMTIRPGETKIENYKRIIKNKRAVPVKCADKINYIETSKVFSDITIKDYLENTRKYFIKPAKAEFGHYQIFKDLEKKISYKLDYQSSRRNLIKTAAAVLLGHVIIHKKK